MENEVLKKSDELKINYGHKKQDLVGKISRSPGFVKSQVEFN